MLITLLSNCTRFSIRGTGTGTLLSTVSPAEDFICRMAVSTGQWRNAGFEAVLGLVPTAQDTRKYLNLVEKLVYL